MPVWFVFWIVVILAHRVDTPDMRLLLQVDTSVRR